MRIIKSVHNVCVFYVCDDDIPAKIDLTELKMSGLLENYLHEQQFTRS